VRVDGALIAVSHDQTFLEGIGVERGDDSLTKRSAVKVSFGSNSDLGPRLSLVRSSLNNGHSANTAACPKSARNGPTATAEFGATDLVY
jgi:hypothetical protein